MRHLVLTPLLLTAASAAAASPQPAQPPSAPAPTAWQIERCREAAPWTARTPRKGVSARKLGELPSGDLMLSVYRTENGCPVRTIVRHGIGR